MIDPNDLPPLPELMIAGPGELHDEDLAAMGHQVIAHYGDVWTQLHDQTLDALGTILGTRARPYLIPGSGTTSLEMAMINLFEPGQKVLVADTGFFGDRLREISTAVGLVPTMLEVEVGSPVDVQRVRETAPGYDGVLTTHVETSTGVRHPIDELAAVVRDAGAAFLVDGIASAGAEVVDVDGWGIDAFVTGTQKGLEAPPGLGVVALGAGGRERVASRSKPPQSWYLDMAVWDRYRSDWASWHPHPVTMPTNIVLALASSLERIAANGVADWVASRADLADKLRKGLAELGFPPVPKDGFGANLVVASWADDPARIQKHLAGEGLMISGGLGPTHDRAIRIGLMGRTATQAHVARLLASIAEA